MSEQTNRGASDIRKRYWQEHGKPPEGEGPHPDRGGPAYIPWLEALVAQLEVKLEGYEDVGLATVKHNYDYVKKLEEALNSISQFYINRHGMIGGGAVDIAKKALGGE